LSPCFFGAVSARASLFARAEAARAAASSRAIASASTLTFRGGRAAASSSLATRAASFF